MKYNKWLVFRARGVKGRLILIDEVYFLAECDEDYIKMVLIENDGLASDIILVKSK
jgi:hypothetical protein